MKPGYELDALIAQKIYNYKTDTVANNGAQETWLKSPGEFDKKAPNWSTDLGKAWELLNLLKGDFKKIGFWDRNGQVEMFRWIGNDMSKLETVAIGETHAHAICLAALKTVS